ncbi:MAG: heparinase II/III family protein [Desulfomonile sp.]|nr:heparinase II/III family protein [Desulfomonile sp.]
MRDPLLASGHFLLDRVAERECLFSSQDVAASAAASLQDDMARCIARGRLDIVLPLPHPDLSRFNRLNVTVHNRSTAVLLAAIKLVHEPTTEKRPNPAISFTGGREPVPPGGPVRLDFPAAGFGWYGDKHSWSSVHSIELSLVFEKTHDGPDEIDVLIGPIEGEKLVQPSGPRLTAQGLAHVFEGDTAPLHPFLPYTPGNSALRIPPPHPFPRDTAEDILHGRIMGQRLTSPISWNADPIGTQEWTHFFNRHHFVRELVVAFVETGDARYIRAVDELIAHWIETNPVPIGSNGGAGPSWETLTAAWRLREWLWVAGICWPHESFRPETKTAMFCSMWEHARSLMDHQGHPTNWIIVESAALALAGICFPWFREACSWRQEGLERLSREVRRQFFSDGVHFEISPLYHAICVGAVLEVYEAASERGVACPHELHECFNRGMSYLAALCRPDFTWPSLNDSGSAQNDFTVLLHKAGEILRRKDFIWIGTRGRRGHRPQERSVVFEDAGIAVMRSGYETGANMLIFRAGPAGAGHVHGDVLSVDVTALGVPRILDPGITMYAPDPLTDHYRSPEAHSMLLVDGRGPERWISPFRDRVKPARGQFSWKRCGSIEIASGMASFQAHCTVPDSADTLSVARTVVFVDGRYWVVRDLVLGGGTHEVTCCWQFAPGRVEIDVKSLVVTCMDARGARFRLMPLAGPHVLGVELATGMLSPPRGWVSLGGADIPAPGLRFIADAPLPCCLVWVLMPCSGGGDSEVHAARTDAADGRVAVEIARETGSTERIILGAPSRLDAISGALGALDDVIYERSVELERAGFDD